MAFELPPLPYAKDALAPHMSAETFDYHYGKHHQAYVNNLNKAVEGTDNEGKSLEDIIAAAEINSGLFNNAAQHWNHSFFWQCMSPNGGGAASGAVADAIGSAFGSYDKFSEEFSNAAATQFGSGWAWLVVDGKGELEITSTANQDAPIMDGKTPVLGLDVWEHAYYLKYQNKRPDYIAAWWNAVNWTAVAANYAAALG